MRQQRLVFVEQQDLHWTDLPAEEQRRLLELLSQLLQEAWRKREGTNNER